MEKKEKKVWGPVGGSGRWRGVGRVWGGVGWGNGDRGFWGCEPRIESIVKEQKGFVQY